MPLLFASTVLIAQDAYSGQDSYSQPPQADYALASRQPLGPDQLEQLVAPIALYPDPLVAQVLAASTYPQQVMEADRWRQEHAYAPAEQISANADVQPWDPSVKALTAFPQVLAQMAHNLQWSTDLGNAYYNQPQDVLEAVQIMRRRAQAAGYLRSTPQEVVSYNADSVQVVPANPEVVYVPAYNPWAVYGEPVSPYPGFSLLDEIGQFLGSGVLRWGLGIGLSAFTRPWGWIAWGLDWLGHALLFHDSPWHSNSGTVADWGFPHRGFYAYSGRGGFGRGHDMGRSWGNEGWRHGRYDAGGWHSFNRASNSYSHGSFDRGSFDHGSFNHGEERRAENWNRPSNRGLESFHERGSNARSDNRSIGRQENRGEHSAFNSRGGFNERGALNEHGASRSESASSSGFPHNEFGGRSAGFSSYSSGKSHGGISRFFGGGGSHEKAFGGGHSSHFASMRAPKSFGGGKGFGGGHAPKSFGGSKGFGGGHSHGGGGHSGGGHSGGGGKHHR